MVTSIVIGGPHNGAPFEPVTAAAARVRANSEIREAAQQRREAHRAQMRELARTREEAKREAKRAARRQYFDEVDAAYAERFGAARRGREQFMQRIGKRSRVIA